MNIATKLLKKHAEDNTTLYEFAKNSKYQDHVPVSIDQDWENHTTTYTFEDGSKLINCESEWEVK